MISTQYRRLAEIYDKVMSHVNYKMWAEHVNNLFQFSDINISHILDISCGTGKHIKFLQSRKRKIIGADLSLAMLKASNKNVAKDAKLIANDARFIAFKKDSFDAILMLYDSVNYMLTTRDVERLLLEVYRVIKPGGLFLFDFVTQEGLKDCYDDYYESDSWDGLAYERHSWFEKQEKIQHNEFLFLFNGKSYKESHIQKIRDINEWRQLIKKSKMQLSHEFSNFSLLPPDRKSERIHFVCRKLL